jgi:hypothetical protein
MEASQGCGHHSNAKYTLVLRDIHRIRRGLASRRCRREFAPNLRRNLRVRMRPHDIAQRVFLLRREVGCIALTQHKQALVPENGERAGCVGVREPDEMEDERVKDLVWQRVFLV